MEQSDRPTPALPSEPPVLRHSFRVLLGGGVLALLGFAAAYRLEGGSQFAPRFEVGLRAATAIAAVTAGLLTWSRLELSRREHHLAADAELTDRFGRAVEQLGSSESVIRVGGVFALERFALDAAARAGDRRDVDWRMALNVLAAFAKQRSRDTWTDGEDYDAMPNSKADPPQWTPPHPPVETVEAVRVLGRFPQRCEVRGDLSHDLSHINLAHVDLVNVDLAGTNLNHASLCYANFDGANLGGANLLGADLAFADLSNARMRNAVLATARMNWARLRGADLTNAYCEHAQVDHVDVSGAVLTGANLDHVDLGNVRDDDQTIWPEEIHRTPGAPGTSQPGDLHPG